MPHGVPVMITVPGSSVCPCWWLEENQIKVMH